MIANQPPIRLAAQFFGSTGKAPSYRRIARLPKHLCMKTTLYMKKMIEPALSRRTIPGPALPCEDHEPSVLTMTELDETSWGGWDTKYGCLREQNSSVPSI